MNVNSKFVLARIPVTFAKYSFFSLTKITSTCAKWSGGAGIWRKVDFSLISIYFELFQSFQSFSIILIYFDSFRSILISILTSELPKCFDGTLAISIVSSCHSKNDAWWQLLPPHFCLFHSHYAGDCGKARKSGASTIPRHKDNIYTLIGKCMINISCSVEQSKNVSFLPRNGKMFERSWERFWKHSLACSLP